MNETAPEIPVTCAKITERGLIEGYVAGTLGPQDIDALESHYLACSHCQTELRLATSIRQALGEGGVAQPRRGIRLGWGIGLALAAGIAGLMLFRWSGASGEWEDLAAVTNAPSYQGVEVRGSPARGDSLFSVAMADYHAQRYAAAASGLRAAIAAGTDSVIAEFLLGSALLMQDRAGDAANAFARVIASGDSPYLAEARLYRAKALLRAGDAAAALSDLQSIDSTSAVGAWSRALADSVSGRLKR